MLVELQTAVFGYGNRRVVQADNLCLYPGRCVGIFGPNGSGKTTLVRGLIGLLTPLSGRVVRINAELRLGYLPQFRLMDMHWPMTAMDAASMAVSAGRRFGWIGSSASAVYDSLAKLNVKDLADKRFATLSGGQQQRVLLAGALASQPQVLVLDEPTDGLDMRSRSMLLHLLKEEKARGLSVVLISHDVHDLLIMADEVAWLVPPENSESASRVELHPPQGLLNHLAHPSEPS